MVLFRNIVELIAEILRLTNRIRIRQPFKSTSTGKIRIFPFKQTEGLRSKLDKVDIVISLHTLREICFGTRRLFQGVLAVKRLF